MKGFLSDPRSACPCLPACSLTPFSLCVVCGLPQDLYVMRRAVEVYQKYIVERFTAQKTDYQQLLKVWAEGFYR